MILIVERGLKVEYGKIYHPNDLDPHFCRLLNYLLTELLTWPIGSGSFTVAAWTQFGWLTWRRVIISKSGIPVSSRNGE